MATNRAVRGSVMARCKCVLMALGMVVAALPIAPARAAPLPDRALLDQSGELLKLRSQVVGDRLAVMNFVFTHCATVCTPLGATFGRLQALLGERLGVEVVLVSISIDPVNDTPQRMQAWAGRFGRGPHWTLLTGAKTDVDMTLKQLAVFSPEAEDHAPLVIIANADGSILQRVPGLVPAPRLLQLIEQQLAINATAIKPATAGPDPGPGPGALARSSSHAEN